MSFSWGGHSRKHCQVCISLSSLRMLGELLSEGIYVWEYLEFPLDSQPLIVPPDTWTRSQIAGIVGDRDVYWNPWLSAWS